MPYYSDEYYEKSAEFAGIQRRLRRLRSRARLDPRDPDALDEDEMEHYKWLEDEADDL